MENLSSAQLSSSGLSSSSQQPAYLHSTPLSQSEYEMSECLVSHIVSEPIVPTSSKKQKTKYSKSEALNLMKDLGGSLAAIKVIFDSFAGTEIDNLENDDVKELQKTYEKHAVSLRRLNVDFKARKFRKDPKTLDTTFIKTSDLPDFLKDTDNDSQDDSSVKDEDDNPNDIDGDEVYIKEHVKRSYYKPLTDLKDSRTRKNRTKEEFEYFVKSAECQGVEFSELLGYFLHRYYYNSNKQLAKFGADLFAGLKDPSAVPEIDVEMGLHIFERYKFGKSNWINFRVLLKNVCKLPAYLSISQLKAVICSKFYPYLDENESEQIGVLASVQECVVKHLMRMIQSGSASWLVKPGNFCAKLVFGMDSRGEDKQHQQRSQVHLDTGHAQSVYYVMPAVFKLPELVEPGTKSSAQDSPDMFNMSDEDEAPIVEPGNIEVEKIGKPLDFQIMEKKVWSDPTPASHRAVRNIGLVMEKENHGNVKRLWKSWLEKELLSFKSFQLSSSELGGEVGHQKDLRKPILIVIIPPVDPSEPVLNCSFKSISVDSHFKGCDMKMTEILTGNVGMEFEDMTCISITSSS